MLDQPTSHYVSICSNHCADTAKLVFTAFWTMLHVCLSYVLHDFDQRFPKRTSAPSGKYWQVWWQRVDCALQLLNAGIHSVHSLIQDEVCWAARVPAVYPRISCVSRQAPTGLSLLACFDLWPVALMLHASTLGLLNGALGQAIRWLALLKAAGMNSRSKLK